MTQRTLTADALALYRLIHRGGAHVYLWGKPCDPRHRGTTRWFHVGERPAVFPDTYHTYHGVHPTTKPGTPYQRAKKGERDIAVVNCCMPMKTIRTTAANVVRRGPISRNGSRAARCRGRR